ncbi:MAG: Nif3-like dinuclear metal center hexameric protein [Methanobrevibacter sp.]|nr:Nif3-like dinuclear metal center hexameric protein [Methanobrevibacter sp.]
MKLKEIIKFLDEKIPESMALDFDNVGLMGKYNLDLDIKSIKIFMDLWPEDDKINDSSLIITHHPPLFEPETPTYTIHSNWDIIDGGANDALAETLNLDVTDYFDNETNIGRVCKFNSTFGKLKQIILDNFDDVKIVNMPNDEKEINNIGIISGFGLKNPKYVKLAEERKLDLLISGDLCQETAILAKNLQITLIDLGHHESEVPGLYQLAQVLTELNIDIEVIDKKPIQKIM